MNATHDHSHHGHHVHHHQKPQHEPAHHDAHAGHAGMADVLQRRFLVSLALSLPLMATSHLGMLLGLHIRLPEGWSAAWFGLILSTPVVWYGGWPFISAAWMAGKRKEVNMMTLIAVGILVSYLYSLLATLLGLQDVFFEAAAMLTTFSLAGHWMEMRSRHATGKAVEALLRLAPSTAHVIRNGTEVEIGVHDVVVGDTIVVRPGDRIAVDARVVSGASHVDESMITGESRAVRKDVGSTVIGGTLNADGAFHAIATAVGANTALSQIVRMVKEAQSTKAPAQRLADAAGRYLVIVALSAGALTFLAWYAWLGSDLVSALSFAVATVVIACPDALALATPTAITVGVGRGARQGLLFKNASALEAAATVDTVVFDKTGTLTTGAPSVTDVHVHGTMSVDAVLALAAAADRNSHHPLANAVVQAAQQRGIDIPASTGFVAVHGKGVQARVDDRDVLVGNAALMDLHGVNIDDLAQMADTMAADARTPVFVAVSGSLVGILAIADTIRDDAKATVSALHAIGIRVVMLSGDRQRTAEAVGRQIGIDEVIADVLPGDKAQTVAHMQHLGRRVAMVGDGVNDAPALAKAQVGIAIGAGTDVAVETAGIVLVKSEPFDVVRAIELARNVRRKIKQNLYWATIYNLIAIPVAAGLLYPAYGVVLRPEWAAIAMSASTVTVTINAMLLRRSAYTALPSH